MRTPEAADSADRLAGSVKLTSAVREAIGTLIGDRAIEAEGKDRQTSHGLDVKPDPAPAA